MDFLKGEKSYIEHMSSKGEDELTGCNWQAKERFNFESHEHSDGEENPEDHQIPPLMDSDNDECDPACLESELLKMDKELESEMPQKA